MKVWPIDPLVPRNLRLEVPEKLPLFAVVRDFGVALGVPSGQASELRGLLGCVRPGRPAAGGFSGSCPVHRSSGGR